MVAGNTSPETPYTEILDLSSMRFSNGPDLPYAVHSMGVAYPEGVAGFLLVGGVSGGQATDAVLEYKPSTSEFVQRSERLQVAAGEAVVFTVDENVANCY